MSNDSIKTQIPGIPDYDSSKTKRCLFKTNEGDYGNINNAELQNGEKELPKEAEIKCVCDGCAERVNDCLANVMVIIEKLDPKFSEYSKGQVQFEFQNHDDRETYFMRGDKKFKQILENKAKCAVKGIDYLAEIKKSKETSTYFGQPTC